LPTWVLQELEMASHGSIAAASAPAAVAPTVEIRLTDGAEKFRKL